MNTLHADYAVACCPNCGQSGPAVEAVVRTGIWERLFLRCRECAESFQGAWVNTHEPAMSSKRF